MRNFEETKEKLGEELEGLTKEKISKEFTDAEKARSDSSVELGKILQQIGQLSSVEVLGIICQPSLVEMHLPEIINTTVDGISYSEGKAEEQRQQASKKFNDNISALMKSLGFTEFRNIKLNKDYRLYVERFNPKTNDYVAQQLKTLATSEKLVIALHPSNCAKRNVHTQHPLFRCG